MPQYLVCNYLPDDFDPSTVTEAMIEEIHALNREMIAAGVRKFACAAFPRPATQRWCGSSLMVRWPSPMGHTPRPRSTWAASGYWKPPIWTRRSRGRARGSISCDAVDEVRELLFFPAPEQGPGGSK